MDLDNLQKIILKQLIQNLLNDPCSGYQDGDDLKTLYEDPLLFPHVDPVYQIFDHPQLLVLEFGWNIKSTMHFQHNEINKLQLKNIMKQIIGW